MRASTGADRFLALGPPTGTTDAASDVGPTSATLNGTVNPHDADVTDCRFAYGPTSAYGQTAPCAATPSGHTDATVRANVTGLKPATTYHVALVVTTRGGTLPTADRTFSTTATPPPTATTQPATGISTTLATLHATVNPHGGAITDCHFEYGPTTAYGRSAACSPTPIGAADSDVAAAVSGLSSGTVTHYRIVLTTSGGTAIGQDATLTTQSALGPPRLRGLRISPARFHAAPAHSRRRGTTVSYHDNQDAECTFTIARRVRGVRHASACVSPARGARDGRRCHRWVRVGRFRRGDVAGGNRFHFTGRIRGRALRPGLYRLTDVARDAAGRMSNRVAADFLVKR